MSSRAIKAYELVLTDSPLLLLPSEAPEQEHPEVSIVAFGPVYSSRDVRVSVCPQLPGEQDCHVQQNCL